MALVMYRSLRCSGKILFSLRSVWSRAWASSSLAWVERGTRCSVPVFILLAGIVQVELSRSTSS